MLRQTFLLICTICFISSGFSQNNRTIDGTLNNLQNADWGAAGAELNLITSLDYEDGISTPAGASRENPRIISNTLFAQSTALNDPLNLSDYTWVFGQFIDHDVVATSGDPTEYAGIHVNFPDPQFNPNGLFPNIFVHMNRNIAMEGTGTSIANPRRHTNNITSWIDGSGVYGSDEERANYLRSFVDGKMKTSVGNMLPFNTTTGELDGEIDPNAPHMENENPFIEKLFVAGDGRANEQPLLIGMHVIFVREHNRLCNELKIAHPDWTDEALYQHARKMVGGFIQSIVYEEWLPAMGVHLPEYQNYDPSAHPNISNVFSAAAFRLGHTLLNSNITQVDNDGTPMDTLTLRDAFFNPMSVMNGLDPFFKGMAIQVEQDCDGKVVDDVRSFLFGPPELGAGGLDLAAININRGRERGLADFNTIRTDLGLSAYTSFSEICSDPVVYGHLEDMYNDDINNIDAWVGMLVENHMPDALFGETIMEIMIQQFGVLRDGDRFYYENDPVLSADEKAEIANTTLRDIIMRNTGITIMQANVFEAMPHDSICTATLAQMDLGGGINLENGLQVDEVNINLLDAGSSLVDNIITDGDGNFVFQNLGSCEHYTIEPSYNEDIRNGVNTFDMVKLSKHILLLENLDSPYKLIAADVNNNGDINVSDLVNLQRVILYLDSGFTNNDGWRFVDANHTFSNPTNPWAGNGFPESVEIPSLSETNSLANFVAIKVGDLTNDADPSNFLSGDTRDEDPIHFYTKDVKIIAGQEYKLAFHVDDLKNIEGYQYTLNFNQDALEFMELIPGEQDNLSLQNFGLLLEHGAITTSWIGNDLLEKKDAVFHISFLAKKNGQLSDLLSLNSSFTNSEAYDKARGQLEVALKFEQDNQFFVPSTTFELYQNKPNPFNSITTIGFNLPEEGQASLTIYDISGRALKIIQQDFAKGYNEVVIDRSDLPGDGLFYYDLNAAAGSLTKKMIINQ